MRSSANRSIKVQPVTIALVAFAYFIIACTALCFLNRSYNLLRSVAGNYDMGSHEFLIASTFFTLGVGSLALVVGLYQGIPQSARSLTSLVFLGIWGGGMLIAGIFPANEAGGTLPHMTTVLLAGIFPVEVEAYPETIYSTIHILALLGSLFSLALAALLLSRRLKQDELWLPIYKLALILAWMMIASSVSFCMAVFFPVLLGHSGRISIFIPVTIGIVLGLVWLFLMAARLRFIVASHVSK